MKEHIKIEQDLSEEQLQEITGGCASCDADMGAIHLNGHMITELMSLSDEARAKGKIEKADTYHQLAIPYATDSTIRANNIAQRHPSTTSS